MLGKAERRIRAFAVLIVLLVVFRASASDLERESFSFVGQALVEIGPFGLDVYQARFLKGRPDETLIELTYLRDVPRYLSLKGWEKGFSPYRARKRQPGSNRMDTFKYTELRRG